MMEFVDGSIPDACDCTGPSYERYAVNRLNSCSIVFAQKI